MFERSAAELDRPEWISALNEDGDALMFSLDAAGLHLEIEINRDGTAEWFFRHREEDDADGDDMPTAFGFQNFVARYRQVVEAANQIRRVDERENRS